MTNGSGIGDTESPAQGDFTYVARMGLVQLFAEGNDSPDDDFFAHPAGLETTNPLPIYSAANDEDEDRGASEVEGEDSDEEYWNEEC